MIRLTQAEFDQLADRAFARIAPRFRKRLENVVIAVEREPPRPGLLGLYQGHPLTTRSVGHSLATHVSADNYVSCIDHPFPRAACAFNEMNRLVAAVGFDAVTQR